MPSTMIHLLTAYQLQPDASGLYWVGNFAPDCANERTLKDKIHLRDAGNRWDALADLYGDIPRDDPFGQGWFLHLFADACWDEKQIPAFRTWYEAEGGEDHWFAPYRQEIARATYYLYHNLPWSQDIWRRIESAPLDGLQTVLPVTSTELQWYRDRVATKHRDSDPSQSPQFFTADVLEEFARGTAERYQEWTAAHV